MLVLSRKSGEEIVCDHEIIIKVIKINGNQVKIGIEAPSQHRILRSEIKTHPMSLLPTTKK